MSDHILKQLYRGAYYPQKKTFYADRAYERLLARKTDMEDRFEEALPGEMREEFIEYLQISGEIDVMEEESAFCEGVRLGMRIAEAVFNEKNE